MREKLIKLSLSDLANAIAADQPAPGAGAAGAVALALAASCAAKAFRISARHRDAEPGLLAAADQADAIARRALIDAEADALAFEAMLREGEGAIDALRDEGEDLVALGATLAGLIDAHSAGVIERLAGDLFAARALAEASDAIARRDLAELDGGA